MKMSYFESVSENSMPIDSYLPFNLKNIHLFEQKQRNPFNQLGQRDFQLSSMIKYHLVVMAKGKS